MLVKCNSIFRMDNPVRDSMLVEKRHFSPQTCRRYVTSTLRTYGTLNDLQSLFYQYHIPKGIEKNEISFLI